MRNTTTEKYTHALTLREQKLLSYNIFPLPTTFPGAAVFGTFFSFVLLALFISRTRFPHESQSRSQTITRKLEMANMAYATRMVWRVKTMCFCQFFLLVEINSSI